MKGAKLTVIEIHYCAHSAFRFLLRLHEWKTNALRTAKRPNSFHINCEIDSGRSYAMSYKSVFLHPYLSLLAIFTGSQIWSQSNLIQARTPYLQSHRSPFLSVGLVLVWGGCFVLIISTHLDKSPLQDF